MEKVNLGISTNGLSPSTIQQLQSSVDGAIAANRATAKAEASNIQRRGTIEFLEQFF